VSGRHDARPLAGVDFPNPVFTASGLRRRRVRSCDQFFDVRCSAASSQSTLDRSARAPAARRPRMAETPSGMLNSIGLQGPGIDAFLARTSPGWPTRGARAVVSIAGGSVEDYTRSRSGCAGHPAVAMIEVNISCPERRGPRQVFACDPRRLARRRRRAPQHRPGVPVFAKLSPTSPTSRRSRGPASTPAPTGCRSSTPCSAWSSTRRRCGPALAGVTGGLSGPAIRPVAVRCVWQVHQALPDVPILGMGGIRTGLDALEFVLAGASAVSVGTTVFGDPTAPGAGAGRARAGAGAARASPGWPTPSGWPHRPAGPVRAETPCRPVATCAVVAQTDAFEEQQS
jgi:dihydroorotate dehydrogenase (NAD+) catalytic subunit